jgi:hypothetical protein
VQELWRCGLLRHSDKRSAVVVFLTIAIVVSSELHSLLLGSHVKEVFFICTICSMGFNLQQQRREVISSKPPWYAALSTQHWSDNIVLAFWEVWLSNSLETRLPWREPRFKPFFHRFATHAGCTATAGSNSAPQPDRSSSSCAESL